MVVADEGRGEALAVAAAFAWVYDITEERCPIPISTIHVDGADRDGKSPARHDGLPPASDRFAGNVVPFAWFAHGLRLVDVSDPFAPHEVARYVPDPPGRMRERASSNDVTVDDRGLIYLIDRQRGVDIVETDAL